MVLSRLPHDAGRRGSGPPTTNPTRAAHTQSAFSFLKTIDEFDFSFQSTVRLQLLGSALSPDFVTEGRCVILSGKPGRGKTHLAVAIAYRAIQNGFDALFVTAAELIDLLSSAFRTGWHCTYCIASLTGVANAVLTACSNAVILPPLTSI